LKKYNVYCDESGTTGTCRHFGIGSLWVQWPAEAHLRVEIGAFRARTNMVRELKWEKVSASRVLAYAEFADFLFTQAGVEFRCIVVDKSKVDYHHYFRGDEEAGFYAFYYHVLSQRAKRLCNDGEAYYVYTDERKNRKASRLNTLRIICNRGYRKNGGHAEPFRLVQPVASHTEDLVQLADVLTGAVVSAANAGCTSPAKLALQNFIAEQAHLPSLTVPTGPGASKFNIWHWRPNSGGKK
jgi:hypothetical protein